MTQRLALCLLAMVALFAMAGCDDPQAAASLAVCQENRSADPRMAEILCEQSFEAAPDSHSGRQAASLLSVLRAERERREDAAYEARRAVLLAQNFVRSRTTRR